MRAFIERIKEAFKGFGRHKVPRLAAALAYYTLFSLAPLLVILIALVGLFLGNEEARSQVVSQLTTSVGPQAADLIDGMIERTQQTGSGLLATIIGVVTLLVGATGVFVQLQSALNEIWEVQPERKGLKRTLMLRLEGLLILLGLGLAALIAVAINAAMNVITTSFSHLLPGADWLWWVANQVVTLGIFTLVFAALYNFVPDANVGWRDVWRGALFTAVLYKIGEVGLGYYLSTAAVGSAYGAAGSLVLLILFIYYASQILLFGAEFTRADVLLRRRAQGKAEDVELKRRAGWPKPVIRTKGSLEQL